MPKAHRARLLGNFIGRNPQRASESAERSRAILARIGRRAMLQSRPPRGSYLGAGLRHFAIANVHELGTMCRLLKGRLKLGFGSCGVETFGGHCPVGEDSHNVVGYLYKPAIDIVGDGLAARLDAHLPVAQPADQRAVISGNSDFTVKQWE